MNASLFSGKNEFADNDGHVLHKVGTAWCGADNGSLELPSSTNSVAFDRSHHCRLRCFRAEPLAVVSICFEEESCSFFLFSRFSLWCSRANYLPGLVLQETVRF